MLLTRFWIAVVALVLGAAVFVLYLATSMFDRAGARAMGEQLSADSQVVSWYLKDDARSRAAQLVKFAVSSDIQKYLAKSSESEDKVPAEARDKIAAELKKINAEVDPDFAFDAVFAVDQHGRVVAQLGYEQGATENFELGGYPVVADGLHGNIRDDTLVLDRMYRVVARPVEYDLGQLPAGAIVGARIVDDRFARELSGRTGAAVAFYTSGQRVASASPKGFDRTTLDAIVGDLDKLDQDADYTEKGRSNVRILGGAVGVVYARLPGEAWELGAGYAVGRLPSAVGSPFGFFQKADDTDKKAVNVPIVAGVVLLVLVLGIAFSLLEHTRPLNVFRAEAEKLAAGTVDQLAPSKFRGTYRKIAGDVNDGIDKVAAKGGVPRRAADLEKVLGDLPAQPAMSAFSFPGDSQAPSDVPAPAPKPVPSAPRRELPKPPGGAPPPPSSGPISASEISVTEASVAQRRPGPPPRPGAPPPSSSGDEGAEWQKVFEDFVALKQQCGENVDGFTYEKFEQTLIKNRDTLVKRHGAKRVKFSVYVKDGKAALKASPLKD
jgi:hypothetical protein